MAEKQSLYEFLGLSDKASPEDVRKAFDDCRRALENEPDSEEKHNRLAVLLQARDILNDRRQRAGYDRRQRDRRLTPAPAPTRSHWPFIVLLLIAGATYPAWRYITADQPAAIPQQEPAGVRSADLPVPQVAVSEDIAALLPPAQAGVAAPAATPKAAAATAPQNQLRPITDSPHAATVAKFSDSTYLIIGAAGFGTGVAIERDKLLTNCHVIAPNVLKGPIFAVSAATGARTRITEAAFLITEDTCVVHAPGLNGKPIALGDAGQLARGTPIFNIGFANGQLIFSTGALLGVINRGGQSYLVSSNYCDHGVSGGPLVDAEGRLVGLTSGGPADRSFCLSLTTETARRVLSQTLIAIDAFPPNYLSNLARRW